MTNKIKALGTIEYMMMQMAISNDTPYSFFPENRSSKETIPYSKNEIVINETEEQILSRYKSKPRRKRGRK